MCTCPNFVVLDSWSLHCFLISNNFVIGHISNLKPVFVANEYRFDLKYKTSLIYEFPQFLKDYN